MNESAQGNDKSIPASVTVVLTTRGYPDDPKIGDVITGIARPNQINGVTVIQTGTKRLGDGRLVTNGGQVASITATASTVKEAREKAYQAASLIDFPGKQLLAGTAENV